MKTAAQIKEERAKLGHPVSLAASPRTVDMEIGRKLNELRISYQLTAAEVGREIGLTRSQVSNIELGNSLPSLPALARLAAFYETTLDHLAGHMVEAAKEEA